MPKLEGDFKKQIKSLSKSTLENIVMRFASKNKEIYDFLIVNRMRDIEVWIPIKT